MKNDEVTYNQHGDVVGGHSAWGRPSHCPECGSELDEPRSRIPHRVKVLGVGYAVFLALMGILSEGILPLLESHLSENLVLVVLFVPGGVITIVAGLAGRIIPMQCFGCGWRKDYRVPSSRKFDLPRNDQNRHMYP